MFLRGGKSLEYPGVLALILSVKLLVNLKVGSISLEIAATPAGITVEPNRIAHLTAAFCLSSGF